MSLSSLILPARIGPSTFNDFSSNRALINNNAARFFAEKLELDFDNGPWLAGGAVRKLYLNKPIYESDWDFFFKTESQFLQAVALAKRHDLISVIRTEYAATFKDYSSNTVLQFINFKYHTSVDDLLSTFDFSVAQCVTDGYNFRFGEYTLQDLENHRMRYLLDFVRDGLISRIVKYRIYGYHMDTDLSELIKDNQNSINFEKTTNDYDI